MSNQGNPEVNAGENEQQNNNAGDAQNNAGANENNNAGGNPGDGNDNFEHNMADPIPHLPLLQNLPDALKLIRKYDGRTNVKEWILRFETDLLAFAIAISMLVCP